MSISSHQGHIWLFLFFLLLYISALNQTEAHWAYGYKQYSAEQNQRIQENSFKTNLKTLKGSGLNSNQYYNACPSGFTGLLPFYNDCHSFLNCHQGQTHIQNCGPGTLFNADTLECGRAEQEQSCGSGERQGHLRSLATNIDSICTTNLNGLLAHPTDCAMFIQCDNGIVHEKNCGPGTAFDAVMMACDFAHKVQCNSPNVGRELSSTYNPAIETVTQQHTSSVNKKINLLCPAGMSGNFPHPFDNQRFLVCVFGQTGIQNCEPTTVYSISKRHCTNRSKTVRPKDYVGHNMAEEKYNDPITLIQCPPQMEGMHVYPYSDQKMVKCDNGNMQILECPFGYKFNHEKSTCELIPNKYMSAHRPAIATVSENPHKGFVNQASYKNQDESSIVYQQVANLYENKSPPSNVYINPKQNTSSYEHHTPSSTGFENGLDAHQPQSPTSNVDRPYQQFPSVYEPKPSLSNNYYPDSYQPKQPSSTNYQSVSGSYQLQSPPSNLRGQHISPASNDFQPGSDSQLPSSNVYGIHHQIHSAYEPQSPASYQPQSRKTNIHEPYHQIPSSFERQPPLKNDHPKIPSTYVPQSPSSTLHQLVDRPYILPTGPLNQSSPAVIYLQCPQGKLKAYPHPFDNAKYLSCKNQQLQVQRCNFGEAFSLKDHCCYRQETMTINEYVPISHSIHYQENLVTNAGQIVCPKHISGKFIHPFDNEHIRYLRCQNGQIIVERCESNTKFDAAQAQCVPYNNFFKSYDDQQYRKIDEVYKGTTIVHTINCPSSLISLRSIPKFYPYPFANSFYLICQFDSTNIRPCKHGLVFEIGQRSCVPGYVNDKYAIGLMSSNQFLCPPTATGQFIYPFESQKFINCQNGNTYIEECPQGQLFSVTRKECFKESIIPETDVVTYNLTETHQKKINPPVIYQPKICVNYLELLCKLSEEGSIQPHPHDCVKYVECQNRQPLVGSCGPGNSWNLERRSCDTYNSQDCKKSESEKILNCVSYRNGVYAHPNNCELFISCNNGIVYEQSCPHGTAWDNRLQVCDFRENVYCDQNYLNKSKSPKTFPTLTSAVSETTYKTPLPSLPNVYYTQPVSSQENTKNKSNAYADNVIQQTKNRPVHYPHPNLLEFSYDYGNQARYITYPIYHSEGQKPVEESLKNYKTLHYPSANTIKREKPVVVSRFGNDDYGQSSDTEDLTHTYLQPPFKNLAPIKNTDKNQNINMPTHRSEINPQFTDSYSRILHMKPQESQQPLTDHVDKKSFNDALNLLFKPYLSVHNETTDQLPIVEHIMFMVPKTILTSTQNPTEIEDIEYKSAGEQFHLEAQKQKSQLKPQHLLNIDERALSIDYQITENVLRYYKNHQEFENETTIEIITPSTKVEDKSRSDQQDYEVRLTGGSASNMGLIEVKLSGKWAYVCDNKFSLENANVVCRELGFHLGASEVRANSYYTARNSSPEYHMDDIECIGNETSLRDCEFPGWGVHNCGPDELVGVVCNLSQFKCPRDDLFLCSDMKSCLPSILVCDGIDEDCDDKSDESDSVCQAKIEYRLNSGSHPNEGRLEIKYHGLWGTVCKDHFSLKEAKVACKSLGYFGKARIVKNVDNNSTAQIWLDDVICADNATSLDQCQHKKFGENNCNHGDDVWLYCSMAPQRRSKQTLNKVPNHIDNEDDDIGLYPYSEQNIEKRCGQIKYTINDNSYYRHKRVINENVAIRGKHPWQATIRVRGDNGISNHWCGGVLLTKLHILTAAHCIDKVSKNGYLIRLGDHDSTIQEGTEEDVLIERWFKHENFRQGVYMNNDIALILLKRKISYNDHIQPICLPTNNFKLTANRLCTITGWGSIRSGVKKTSKILRAAQLPILPDTICRDEDVHGGDITNNMFCAGTMNESDDACSGDSGGPLACKGDGGEILYGIISWGENCGLANKPGVYVRVENYIDWILNTINISMQHFSR